MDNNTLIKEEKEIRKILHAIPEKSLCEVKTRRVILSYLNALEGIEIVDKGEWFYAFYKGKDSKKKIAFRADYDAVEGKDTKVGHYCGHDGHCATLLVFAKYISELKPDNDIYFIFQPAEEIGKGALMCRDVVVDEEIDEIYGFHNIPKFKRGNILVKKGAFACASGGLRISITGTPSHAAYPEHGKNPALIIAKTIEYCNSLSSYDIDDLAFVTVIGVELGSDAYGVSASNGILKLTFRAQRQEHFDDLFKQIISYVNKKCLEADMSFEYESIETFASSKNNDDCVDRIISVCKDKNLSTQEVSEPFRWSEDFGYYLEVCKGAFFGVGDVEDYSQLHTEDFEYLDEISRYALQVFMGLI